MTKILFSFFLVGILSSTVGAQNLLLLPNPTTGNVSCNSNSGELTPWITNSNKMYYLFSLPSGKFQLGEYNSLTNSNVLINNLNTNDGGVYDGQIAFNGKVYFIYAVANGKLQLGEYNGTTITIYPNPDNGNGLLGYPVVYNNKLYYKYKDVGAKGRLACFDGTSVTLIANPVASDPGYHNNPIVYNNKLYFAYKRSSGKHVLAQYDGFSISLINNPNTTDAGLHSSDPIIYNGKLCLKYTGSGVKNFLAEYDGSGISIVNNANVAHNGYYGSGVVHNGQLYFLYGDGSIPTRFQLASWNGTSMTFYTNPNTSTGFFGRGVVLNNKVHFGYASSSTTNQIAELNGTTVNLIANPETSVKGITNTLYPVVFGGKMYFSYKNSSNILQIAVYNGSSISTLTNPDSGQLYEDLIPSSMTEYAGRLYVNYISSGTNRIAIINPCSPTTQVLNESICANSSYFFNGAYLNTAGTYFATFANAQGCDSNIVVNLTVTSCSNPTLKVFLQGFYSGGSQMQPVMQNQGISGATASQCDWITINLHQPTAPYSVQRKINTILGTNGVAICPLPASFLGNPYWISIEHRSTLETWSANTVTFNAATQYNFTNAANKAFGNNQVEVDPGVFALYSGDIIKDGSIDGFDYIALDADLLLSSGGYIATDITGDGVVDSFDYILLDNNLLQGIGSILP